MNIKDFDGTSPPFDPDRFFVGESEGWAVVEGPMGGLQRRATITAHGTTEGGVIRFRETWTFDDGKVDTLDWRITSRGEGRFSGAEPTLVDDAEGRVAGCAFHWTYSRDVPGDDGNTTRLNFDDWFFRIDDVAVIVKGTAGRLGLPFTSAHVTYRKLSGVEMPPRQ